ncbi:15080_t:CDS:2, partial [Gigaspora rosea]
TISDWAEREMIRRHINYKRSTLNLSKMPDTQDITVPISIKTKAHKPNGNSRRVKKGNQVDRNALGEINESELKSTQDMTTFTSNSKARKPNGNSKKAKKGNQVDRNKINLPIDGDESELSLSENNNG